MRVRMACLTKAQTELAPDNAIPAFSGYSYPLALAALRECIDWMKQRECMVLIDGLVDFLRVCFACLILPPRVN